nr:hypothetical protein [Paenibacillus koleovorans]
MVRIAGGGSSSLLRVDFSKKAGRVTRAMLGMKKMDIAELKKAYEG